MNGENKKTGLPTVLDFSGVDVKSIAVVESTKLLNIKGENAQVASVAIDGGLYKDNLPEGLDMKIIKAVNKYDKEYIQAVTEAAVTFGTDVLAANANADMVIFKAPFRADDITKTSPVINIEVNRSKNVVIPGKPTEQRPTYKVNVKTKYGVSGSLDANLKTLMQDRLSNK